MAAARVVSSRSTLASELNRYHSSGLVPVARVSSSGYASSSGRAGQWGSSPHKALSRLDRRGDPPHGTALFAKRRGGSSRSDPDLDPATGDRDQAGGFRFSNRRGVYRVQYNEYDMEVRQEEAWKLLVPLVGGLVLAAAVIGPLVIGIAFTAIAIGAALSAGALFTSLFLPFFVLIGAGALFFGGLTFSAFATLGTALLLPKLISLAVVAGGLGLGGLAVSLFLKPAADRAKVTYEEPSRRGDAGPQAARGAPRDRRDPQGHDPDLLVEAEVVDPEVERQLREFDQLLAGREEQRRRADRFKAGGR